MTNHLRLLSPFRYPGGKTWLIPHIRQWFKKMGSRPAQFVEPFAGGSSVGLTVAFEELADHVILVERDDQVAAVWQTILYGDGKWLANRIAIFDLTTESIKEELSRTPYSLKEKAFQTILKNRVSRGGILAPGAGVLRDGEKGRGLKSRWYPETLKKRILQIAEMRERITFIKGDGIEVLKQNADRAGVVFFIDPPYTVSGKGAGRRLYSCYELDHEELFSLVSMLVGDFLMTYSNDEKVRRLAQKYKFDTQEIAMRNTHHVPMTELLIGRNLGWIR